MLMFLPIILWFEPNFLMMLFRDHNKLNNHVSHEIEADYKEDYDNEDRQCQKCTSFSSGYCSEAQAEVSATGHCDFFQSID